MGVVVSRNGKTRIYPENQGTVKEVAKYIEEKRTGGWKGSRSIGSQHGRKKRSGGVKAMAKSV